MSAYVHQYMWVGGGYVLNSITRSLDRTHPIQLWLHINGKENKASRRADHTTTGKLADVCQDILVAFMQEETLLSMRPLCRLTSFEAPPADTWKNIISLPNSPETVSLRTKGSRWGFRPSVYWESCWVRHPSIQSLICIINKLPK